MSLLEELIEERRGEKSIKYSGVWDESVWLFEDVSVREFDEREKRRGEYKVYWCVV